MSTDYPHSEFGNTPIYLRFTQQIHLVRRLVRPLLYNPPKAEHTHSQHKQLSKSSNND